MLVKIKKKSIKNHNCVGNLTKNSVKNQEIIAFLF
jgi:hypothetical protein